MVRIYADESVNVAIVEGLKRRGIDAFSARDAGKLGLSDEEQSEFAMKNRAVIFTHDVDFLRMALDREHYGDFPKTLFVAPTKFPVESI